MSFQPSKYINKLTNKRILIFGGTSGVGFCVAEASIEHGANVIISNSNPTRLEKALSKLRATYPNSRPDQIKGYTLDLSDAENMEANYHTLLAKVTEDGELNHVAFTAGDAIRSPPVSEMNADDFRAGGTVRVLGVLMLAKVLPKYMDLNPGNSFTFTGGTNGDRPMKGRTLMAAWSTVTEGLMRGLAVDLQPLRVNLVSLGAVQTELWESFMPDLEARKAFMERMAEDTTVKEVGKPEDTAEAYIYFMKDRFVTGDIIRTNGGRLLANS